MTDKGDMTLHEALAQKFGDGVVGKRAGRGQQSYDYIEARTAMDRLDEVVGPLDWSTSYRVVDPERMGVECTLTIRGTSKADIGYPNNPLGSPGGSGEPGKDAYSDALKRAAVQWGIARYLYPTAAKQERYAQDASGSSETVREERAPAAAGKPATRYEGAAKTPTPDEEQTNKLRSLVATLAQLTELPNMEIVAQVQHHAGADLTGKLTPPMRAKAMDWLEGQIAQQTLARESQRA